jgi:glycosyltransferase involved in cell wall biosynthesis
VKVLPPLAGDFRTGRFPSDAVIDIYKAADVFALPSLNEGFGLVALEAMAAGLPVVANDVTGIRDVVADGADGLLCRPADPESMATAIACLLDDTAMRDRLVAAGCEKARAHDWATIGERYLQVYREAIAAQSRR